MYYAYAPRPKVSNVHTRGFALPTILIASIVMFMVMLVAIQAASSVSVGLQAQYYNTLAREASESGVAYAKACLAESHNVVTWQGKTLKPNTNCQGNQLSGFTCPTDSRDARCAVSIKDNIKVSFSVPEPDTDSQGQPTRIGATGTTSLLRNSSGVSWRSFTQSTTVAPDVCSPTSFNTPGWSNAVATPEGQPFPDSSAMSISIANSSVNAGPIYFRKDFIVTQAGSFALSTLGDDIGEVFIDGSWAAMNTYPDSDTSTVSLTPGCHTMVVKITNYSILPNPAKLTLSLKAEGAATPLLVSDTTWRAVGGNAVQFSSPNYFADPNRWTTVRDFGSYSAGHTPPDTPGTWPATTSDSTAEWISTNHSYDSSNYNPANSYALFRDNNDVTVGTSTPVTVYVAADDNFVLYMDGQQVGASTAGYKTIVPVSLTLAPGTHKFGLVLGNGSGPSAFLLAVKQNSNGLILTKSSKSWTAAYYWNAANTNPSSYDKTFTPSGIPAFRCPCKTITNMITNPSFETDLSDVTVVNSTISRSTAWHTSGSYSLVHAANGTSADDYVNFGGGAGGMRIGFQAGKTYTITADAKVTSIMGGTTDTRGPGIDAYYYNGAYDFTQASLPNAVGQYHLRLTWTVPADATQAFVRLYLGGTSGTIYWDSLMVTEGLYAYAYRDGSSPGWTWTGAAGSSPSLGPAPSPIP